MNYLVTGHTGFKGTWLTAMLLAEGHKVSGISLDPVHDSLFTQTNLASRLEHDFRFDIRNQSQVLSAVEKVQPEIVVHLAAQPLVRKSYLEPIFTFETNILGTLNVLNAISQVKSIRASLIVTTDKVYRDTNKKFPYLETDALGGSDPYSASKSAADILTQSWIQSVPAAPIAIARAGNVIGGGDWAVDRLIPDTVTALMSQKNVFVRNPDSIRPWQHVLDCLNGYKMGIENLLSTGKSETWNFGPPLESNRTVLDVVNSLILNWGSNETRAEVVNSADQLKESSYLLLNSIKAREGLGWSDLLHFEETMKWTSDWYKRFAQGTPAEVLMDEQINRFHKLNS